MRRVRIAAQVAPQHTSWSGIRDVVMRMEDLGVDIVFNWDHFFPLTGDLEGTSFESWTMLAAIAEQTERVEFGPLVSCTGFRNADLQADMARTIDHISAKNGVGRFIFGTGSGWFERDFVEYGYEFGTAGQRLDRLAEDLPRVRTRWAKLNPAPTRRIPILIGGGGERKTLRIVAEHADIWHSFADPEEYAHKLGVLDAWCAEVGRDRSEIELSTGLGPRGQGSVNPAVLDTQYALGITLFEAVALGPDFNDSPVRALLDWRRSRGLDGA
ncbi:MAG: LLM class F420-dependent oxidoreductase [Rhodoglobus sp.]|nr:LLM class F420-dependent oxidoreductase [Rhodoglobus sp.]